MGWLWPPGLVSTAAVGSGAVRDLAGRAALQGRIARLEDENAALREEQQLLEDEHQRLQDERERLRGENERLRAEGERLREANERLRGEVEGLRRAAKRQAAPFSKGDPKADPKRAGRKPGAAHGRHAHRQPPEPVDRVVAVGLPGYCPGCGGELVAERVAPQHVEDLPEPRPLRIRYEVHVGRCRSCGLRVQPRHPAQTSDALGAAGAQLGPRAVALAAWLSKGLGVPAAKIARLLGQLGLGVTPGGVTGAVARAARRAQPTYQSLTAGVRASPVVAPDETGWRVGGVKAWLWAFVGDQVTVYRIACGRATRTPPRFSARTMPACWNATVGRRIAALRTRATRAAWRTCCAAAGSWSPTPTAGKLAPRTRCAASSSTHSPSATRATPAPWTPSP